MSRSVLELPCKFVETAMQCVETVNALQACSLQVLWECHAVCWDCHADVLGLPCNALRLP